MSTSIMTYSGKYFDFRNPDASMVDIESIAHALSQTARYGGHTPTFYSVAQHSVLCSIHAPEGFELEALCHDMQEAYVGDVPRPMKALMEQYQNLERKAEVVIRKWVGVPVDLSPEVREVDRRMLATEARWFGMPWWAEMRAKPYDNVTIFPWGWNKAKAMFLLRWEDLKSKEGAQ